MQNRIKELRKKIGLDQIEFANRIGVKQSTISGYESGRRVPSEAIIKSICKEFRINEEWVKNGTGEMEILPVDADMDNVEDLIDNPDDEFNALILQLKKCYDSFDDVGKQVLRDFARKFREESEK